MNRLTSLAAVIPLLSATFLFAQAAKPLPPGGTPLLPADIAALKLGADAASAEAQVVPVEGQPFTQALRARTKVLVANTWNLELMAPTIAPVKKGDVILASFYARMIESRAEAGEAYTEVVFERHGEPYNKSLEVRVAATKQWKRFDLPFVADGDYAPGAAQINFQIGFQPQVIEIANVTFTNYQNQVKLRDLPATASSYAGREPDAAWRKEAAQRIEQNRKGDLTVAVTAGGRPVEGASVAVNMTRHAFGFGSAVAARALNADTPDGQKYRDTIAKLYNKVVFENDLKWPNWEQTGNRASTMKAAQWLKDHHIAIRGHNLVWPSWRFSPRDLQGLKDNPTALRERISKHILEEAGAMKGWLVEWDVINEPYTNHDVMDVLGKDAMVEWFKLARQAEPDARLFLNDYSILTGGGADKAHQDHFEATLKYLIDQGAPIGGAGMQGHFGRTLTDPAKVVQILDRYAKLGLAIEITEHDIDITDEDLQADYTRDFLTAVFSHPQVIGFLTWGFWEGAHWKPNGAYFRRDWSVKPAGQAFMDLVLKEWWTKAQGATTGQGEFRTRGFLGEYEVTVTHQGRSKTVPATLGKDGARVQVTMD